MLRYIVIQYINGRTDWYDLAAFEYASDAQSFSDSCDDLADVEVREIRQVKYEFVD